MPDNSPVTEFLDAIVNTGIQGFGVLPSAEKVAEIHAENSPNTEAAIDSVIAWRSGYASITGFLTGLGSVVTLPISIPASLLSCYALGANTAGAIAVLRGYELKEDAVRTFILLSILGEAGVEVLIKTVGANASTKIAKNIIAQIPSKVLLEINRKVGIKLLSKTSEKSIINLTKIVPLVGGAFGAGMDSFYVNACGQTAKVLFKPMTVKNVNYQI
ncbi:MAG: EcsC family protein [Prochloraceae cyanobacterium]|nr:EcsC family protein [Prochloraceae cyanobacterium]